MAVNPADVIAMVKARLQLSDSSRDALIDSYVAEIEHRILSYCNLDQVPDGLKWTWVSMVMDAVRVELSNIDEIAETADRGESIRLGDVSVTPMPAAGTTNTNKAVIDGVVLNYRVDLNRYRKLRW